MPESPARRRPSKGGYVSGSTPPGKLGPPPASVGAGTISVDDYLHFRDEMARAVEEVFERAGRPDDPAVEDVLQTVYVAGLAAAAPSRNDPSLGAFFKQLARRSALNYLKRGQRERASTTEDILASVDAEREAHDDPGEAGREPSLDDLLRDLTPRQYEALWKTVIQEMPMREVADEMGLSNVAVSQLVRGAKRILRQAIAARERGPEQGEGHTPAGER